MSGCFFWNTVYIYETCKRHVEEKSTVTLALLGPNQVDQTRRRVAIYLFIYYVNRTKVHEK